MTKLWFKPADLKQRYSCLCAGCKQEIFVAPSMMMSEFGENTGSGKCPKCHEFLHLEIDQANSSMVSELFDKFAAQQTCASVVDAS